MQKESGDGAQDESTGKRQRKNCTTADVFYFKPATCARHSKESGGVK